MKDNYSEYEDALSELNLQSLDDRRQMLALRFAKKCATYFLKMRYQLHEIKKNIMLSLQKQEDLKNLQYPQCSAYSTKPSECTAEL